MTFAAYRNKKVVMSTSNFVRDTYCMKIILGIFKQKCLETDGKEQSADLVRYS